MRNKLRKTVTANWPLKVMSLALAVFSWFLVTEAGVGEMTIEKVFIEVQEPAGAAVWTVSRPYLRVKLRGPASELRRIKPVDVRARYVVEKRAEFEGLWAIDVDCKEKLDFGLVAGVRVTEVIPTKIKIELARRKTAEVPVEAQFVGRPAPGFEIGAVRIIPQRVAVEGPEPVFEDLRVVQTIPINCSGRDRSFTQKAGLAKTHKEHELGITDVVEVAVQISEESDIRVLEALEIMVMKPTGWKRDVVVSPDMINVTVKGQEQILAVLKADKVVPFVRVVKEESGTYKLPVEVSIYLEGVEVVGVLPNVDVSVGK
jgi:hypothetical protein